MSKRERRGVEASEAEVRGAGESGDDAPPVETGLGGGDEVGEAPEDRAAEVEIDPAAVDEAVKEAVDEIAAGGVGGGVEKTVYEVQYREPVPEPVGVPSTAGFGDDREFDAELPVTAALAVGALTPEQIAAELAWWESEAHDPTKRKKAAAEVYAEAVENKRLMIAQLEREVGDAQDRKRRVENLAQTQLERIRLLRIAAAAGQK